MDPRKPYFFVGIGGSGMMPLAMILAARGATVAGSDRSLDAGRLPAKFDDLRAKGVKLFPQDGSGITSADQTVVASAAVEASVPDIVAADRVGAARMTRAELNAQLFNASTLPIGVAGTSGKSTVTGMIGWILAATGRDPTVMNGAVMKNFVQPEAPFASALVGNGDAYVSEVDESDGSIALYSPRIAVLNNVSLDHKTLDELRVLFGAFIAKAGHAIVNADDADAAALAMTLPKERVTTFSLGGEADLVAVGIVQRESNIYFEVLPRGSPVPHGRVAMRLPGRHNVANAMAAIAAAVAAGVPIGEACRALCDFAGLKRRFELVGSEDGITVIDDFAHNPDKIAATLDTLHAFPGVPLPNPRRLFILFQPHGFGPLKVMRRELVAMFAEKLGSDDFLVLSDPAYFGGTTSREVTSQDIVTDIAATGHNARYIPDRDAAAAHILSQARSGDRIVVMGARDDTLSQLAADMLRSIPPRRNPLAST